MQKIGTLIVQAETDEDFSEDDDDAEAWPRQVENAFMVQALDDAYRGLMYLKGQEARHV